MRRLPRPGLPLLAPLLLLLLPPAARGDCGKPAEIPHAILRRGELKNSYPVGTSLTFRCIPGYELIHKVIPQISCSPASEWLPKSPRFCEGRRCPFPNLDNGKIVSSTDLRLGDKIIFACNVGYRLIGDNTARCTLKSGRVDWDNNPSCQRIPCFPPPSIQNGGISGGLRNEYDFGATVTYYCDKSYSLIGKKNLICGVAADGQNGAWDSPPPQCKMVQCRRPDINHGSISAFKPSYPYDHTLVVTCDAGYSLLGANLIKCGSDNNWNPPIPTCVFGTIATTVFTTVFSGGGATPDTTTVTAFTTVPSEVGTAAASKSPGNKPASSSSSETKPEDLENNPDPITILAVVFGTLGGCFVITAIVIYLFLKFGRVSPSARQAARQASTNMVEEEMI